MNRILIIEECIDCCHLIYIENTKETICMLTNKTIDDENSTAINLPIPEWCPLPKANEVKNE